MNVQLGGGACEKTRKYLDSYISNELLVETNHEVLRHIESCPACSAELEARTRLRARLKAAVTAQPVPPELSMSIRERIRRDRPSRWFSAVGWQWLVAVPAALVLCAGLWLNYSAQRLPALTDRPAQNAYIQRVSATLAAVMKVGLGDHIHCSIFRKYPKDPPPLEKLEANLGPSFQGLLPIMRAGVPDGYRIIMAHQCGYAGRKFIHLTFRKGNDLLSLVVARRYPGESLAGLSPASAPAGIPIYQSPAARFQVAGFEAGPFLAYVVSGLKGQTNLQVAANIAPAVRELLQKLPA